MILQDSLFLSYYHFQWSLLRQWWSVFEFYEPGEIPALLEMKKMNGRENFISASNFLGAIILASILGLAVCLSKYVSANGYDGKIQKQYITATSSSTATTVNITGYVSFYTTAAVQFEFSDRITNTIATPSATTSGIAGGTQPSWVTTEQMFTARRQRVWFKTSSGTANITLWAQNPN